MGSEPEGRRERMNIDNAAALSCRWMEEVWNGKRASAIDEMFAPDGIAHGLDDDGDIHGPEAFKKLHATLVGAFPDLHVVVEDVVGGEDKAAVRISVTATHTGDLPNLPATGRSVRFTGMTFTRWREGKIVEGWNNVDFSAMMRQLTQE
jgi:steroid delta-isomerase-like uncharacterized protein